MVKVIDDCPRFAGLSLGGKQLVRTYAYNRGNEGKDPMKSVEEDVIPYVSWIEKMERGRVTYGLDIALPFEMDRKVLQKVNELAGTSTMKPSEINGDMTELRINPSYSPIMIYLTEELWRARIIPVDHTISYGLSVCGEKIIEKLFLLSIANVAHGLTLELSKREREVAGSISPETLVQPMVEIAQGRDIYTGNLIPSERINLYTGITARLQKTEVQDKNWKEVLENDFRTRIKVTMGIENLPSVFRLKCEREVYMACSASLNDINRLREEWEQKVKNKRVIDLIDIISEERSRKVAEIIDLYRRTGMVEVGKIHQTECLPEEKKELPTQVDKGIDWMIDIAMDDEPAVAERGIEMLRDAGGKKAESVFESIRRARN